MNLNYKKADIIYDYKYDLITNFNIKKLIIYIKIK